MPNRECRIAQAWLESPSRGVIELTRDWRARYAPPLLLGPEGPTFSTLTRVPDYVFGAESGYFANKKGEIFFFLRLDRYPELSAEGTMVYLAGDFNGWQNAVGQPEWQLRPSRLAGDLVLLWSGAAQRFYAEPFARFKFVTGDHRWLNVNATAPNAVRDDAGNINCVVDPERTGQHLFQFTLSAPLDLSVAWTIVWQGDEAGQSVPLRPGEFLFSYASDALLGATVQGGETTFRLFASRASSVELCVCENLGKAELAHRYVLKRRADHVWEITLAENLHGWYYWYHVDGPSDVFGQFDPKQPVLDPYALATVDRTGPGIVLDRALLPPADRSFKTPDWQDLIIAEAHVRDLVDRAPVKLAVGERRGFSGLKKWVESPAFYLHHLGVNAVELQPVQEFDNRTTDEYHWGYMTNNYFAPESSYALEPLKASGVTEFQELVSAFHKRGIAVILDVVYNHVGDPAHLMLIDKLYYFEMDSAGQLSNWSGCGNDLRADAAMAKRLIIDSLTHLVEMYGVDGFRLDLAELLGLDVLREVEAALKRVKPDVILIAEPWSFRGHIAGQLRDTGWASWNDGYRNFLREFVRGGGSRESFEYFLKGSPWHFAKWPAQTINYTESHDDRTWIDMITENPNYNGSDPTANDRRRTHLMAAVLFASIGIPMISAGQDFLRSKNGVNNTYQLGAVNALDYRRIYRFSATHTYFADWIAFRRSDTGKLLRLYTRPSETYFRFFFAQDSTATAAIYNADLSQGSRRLLFAVNPTMYDVIIPIGEEIAAGNWSQLADHERFFGSRPRDTAQRVTADLFVPALGCGLWIAE
ncbi:MAG: alpha-amylase family glycosyl hydrolase [Nibricoccus sp.]